MTRSEIKRQGADKEPIKAPHIYENPAGLIERLNDFPKNPTNEDWRNLNKWISEEREETKKMAGPIPPQTYRSETIGEGVRECSLSKEGSYASVELKFRSAASGATGKKATIKFISEDSSRNGKLIELRALDLAPISSNTLRLRRFEVNFLTKKVKKTNRQSDGRRII